MANQKLKFVLVKSALPSAVEPYNGLFVNNSTISLDDLAERAAEGRTNVDAPSMKLVVDAGLRYIADNMALEARRYHTGIITFEPAIGGSLPTMDAPLTEDNPIYVAARFTSDFTAEIAEEVPSRETDDAISVKIDDILDVWSGRIGVIHATDQFQVTGRNINASMSDESLVLIDSAGNETLAIVDTTTSGMGQRIVANCPNQMVAGTGTLVLTTHGFSTPDGPLTTIKRNVTIEAQPSTLTAARSYSDEGEGVEGVIVSGMPVQLDGTNLTLLPLETVKYWGTYNRRQVNGYVYGSEALENSETRLRFSNSGHGADFMFDSGSTVKFTVKGKTVSAIYSTP